MDPVNRYPYSEIMTSFFKLVVISSYVRTNTINIGGTSSLTKFLSTCITEFEIITSCPKWLLVCTNTIKVQRLSHLEKKNQP